MKARKKIEYALKNSMHIVALISIFIVIILIKQNPAEINLAMQEQTNQEEKVAKEIQEREITPITSRHSLSNYRDKTNIDEVITQEQIQEDTHTKIEDLQISRDMDLTITTGLSKEDFKTLISNVKYDTSKFFYNNSDLIYDLCQQYQINEIFLCGLISAESGWDIAYNHRISHNYISLMSKNGLIRYSSLEEGLSVATSTLHNNYLTEGGRFYHGKTLYGVKTIFCPSSTTWVELVYGRMQQIINSK